MWIYSERNFQRAQRQGCGNPFSCWKIRKLSIWDVTIFKNTKPTCFANLDENRCPWGATDRGTQVESLFERQWSCFVAGEAYETRSLHRWPANYAGHTDMASKGLSSQFGSGAKIYARDSGCQGHRFPNFCTKGFNIWQCVLFCGKDLMWLAFWKVDGTALLSV